jgi:hypothetical protein
MIEFSMFGPILVWLWMRGPDGRRRVSAIKDYLHWFYLTPPIVDRTQASHAEELMKRRQT